MNKNLLRETIMRGIKKSLNEAFTFESDPVGDEILNIVSKNENIANVVKDATEEDWSDLINKIKEMATNRLTDVKMPSKITNLDSLAKAFISKMDVTNVNIIKKMEDDEIKGLVDYLHSDVDSSDDEPKAIGQKEDDTDFPFESKNNGVKECGGACKENEEKACPKCGKTPCTCEKEVKESRKARMARRLNENRRRHLNESSKDEKLANLYQLLCNAQDLAEEAGELGLMYEIQDLRYKVDSIRFGR